MKKEFKSHSILKTLIAIKLTVLLVVFSVLGTFAQQQLSEMETIGLDEVVAIGYGVQQRSNVTGSISSVKAADMENRIVTDAAQALQGKAAGVQIVNQSGAPGATSNIQIRGYTSNSRTAPLIIVDGLKVQNLNFLDTDNIASIEILKDGASAAIYGVEGGNGVILVTTKTGTSTAGQGRVFYNMQHATQQIANKPKLLNARQYMDYMLRTGVVADERNFQYDGFSDTDWIDRITETGLITRHTLGFEGGNDRGRFYTSLTSTNDDGIVIGDKDIYKRLTGQINADYKIKDWLTVGITTSLEKTESRSISEGSAGGILGSAINADPITPWTYAKGQEPQRIMNLVNQGRPVPKDENGLYYGDKYIMGGSWHPAASLMRSDSDTKSFNIRGTGFLNFSPVKGFTFTSRFGYRAGYTQTRTYNHEVYCNSYMAATMSISGRAGNSLYYQWENFGNYVFDVNGHNFTVMAGMSYQRSQSDFVNASANSLSSTEPLFRYLSNALNTSSMSVSGIPSESSNMSYYGRLGWTHKRKYDLQASFRADAYDTSKLHRDSRWGYFPSISGGWTISNESFMDNIKSKLDMSSLRFRASYGINGNVNALGNYQYSTTLSQGVSQGYDFGNGTMIIGTWPSAQLPNPGIKWETTRQFNVGFNSRFLRDRLTFDFDVFDKNTHDLIVSTAAPANTGASTVFVNAGKVNNRGLEIELGWRDRIGDFTYSFNGNISFLKNKVVKGPSSTRINGAAMTNMEPSTYFEEGYPIWYLCTYVLEGINPNTGRAIYKNIHEDYDKDGKPIIDAKDREYTGSAIPDYTYGLTLNLGYKNFDLTIYGTGVGGVQKLFALNRGDFKHNNTLVEFYEGMWSPNKPNARFPLFHANDLQFKNSDIMIFDASFLKIKQVQLGYNVPTSITSKVKIQRLRAFVSLDDWFVFTKYPGYDPETSGSGSGMALDQAAYPISKKVLFGINVSF